MLVLAGNATAVATRILASMYLDVTQQAVVTAVLVGNNNTLSNLEQGPALDTTNATAYNISQAVSAANLSASIVTSALEQAVAASVSNVQNGSDPAILIQAAVLLGQNEPAVTQGFAMVMSF